MARHQGILYSHFSAPSFALFALKEKTIPREGHFCSAFANFEKKKKVSCLFVFCYYWELNHVLVEISVGWITQGSHFCSLKKKKKTKYWQYHQVQPNISYP